MPQGRRQETRLEVSWMKYSAVQKKTGGSFSTRPSYWPLRLLACWPLLERVAEAEHELVDVKQPAGRLEGRGGQLAVDDLHAVAQAAGGVCDRRRQDVVAD